MNMLKNNVKGSLVSYLLYLCLNIKSPNYFISFRENLIPNTFSKSKSQHAF